MIFTNDEKRVMFEDLDDRMWGSNPPFEQLLRAATVVLHAETIRALESLWGDRWLPREPAGPTDDFWGELRGPGPQDRTWKVYRGVYADPKAVHFRMMLRDDRSFGG